MPKLQFATIFLDVETPLTAKLLAGFFDKLSMDKYLFLDFQI